MFAYQSWQQGAYGGGRIAPSSAPSVAAAVPEDACMAEVRFEDASACEYAMEQLNNVEFKGKPLQLALDPASKDRTKIIASGVPMDADWQELKDHFNTVPKVAFVAVIGNKRKLAMDGPSLVGEVRMETAEEAQQAIEILQRSAVGGSGAIQISMDQRSKDGTKLVVNNIPAGVTWQELKVHFLQAGTVAYANVSGGAAFGTLMGEVRYDDPNHTQQAYRRLNGSSLGGSKISLMFAPGSVDNSKLLVEGIPPGTGWQELKDHFAQIAPVAFAQVSDKGKFGGKGGGKGGAPWGGAGGGWSGGGGNDMMPMMMMMPMGADGQSEMWSGGRGGAYGGGYGKAGGGGRAAFSMPYVKGYGNMW